MTFHAAPVAVVSSWDAVVHAVAFGDYQRRGGFDRFSSAQRAEVDGAIGDVEAAGRGVA